MTHPPSSAALPQPRHLLRLVWHAQTLLFLSLLFVYPVAAIMRLGLIPAVWADVLGDPYYQGVVWFSFWQAILSTMLTLAVGIPAAFVFTRLRFTGQRLLRALTLVPFVLPTVVVAAGFVALLGSNGLLGDLARLLGRPPPEIIGSLSAILLAHVFYNVGLVVRLVGSVWLGIDQRIEQAAATLGARKLLIFRRITLPLLMPGIAAAALLIFIFTFGSFGIILLLGGPRMATLEVEIYRQTTQNLNLGVAAALALLQAIVTIVAGLLYAGVEQPAGRANLWSRPNTLRRPQGLVEKLLVAGIVLCVLLLMLPLLALVWRSLTLPPAPGLAATPTLDYYRMLSENRRGSLFYVPPTQAIANSLGFAGLATSLALLVGIPAAFLITGLRTTTATGTGRLAPIPRGTARRADMLRVYSSQIFNIIITLPIGVSTIMLGLGYIVAWGPFGILDSPLLIPAAHALLAFPFVVRSLVPAIQGLSPRLREAARMLSATPARVLLAVELPLLAPAIVAAAVFAGTVSLGDYGAALLLSRPEYPTIPIVIARFLGQPGAANYGQALALSTLLMLVSIGSFVLIEQQ